MGSETLSGVTIRKKKGCKPDRFKNLQPICEESAVCNYNDDRTIEKVDVTSDLVAKFDEDKSKTNDLLDLLHPCRIETQDEPDSQNARPLPVIPEAEVKPELQPVSPQHNDDYDCDHIKMGIIQVAPNGPPGFFPACHVCNKVPSTGVLYYCQHDDLNDYYHSPFPYTLTDETEPHILELVHLGISHSIVQQAKAGLYTDEQLEKLKAQKRDVHALICQRLIINGSGSDNTPPIMEAIEKTCYLNSNRHSYKAATRPFISDPTVKVKDFAPMSLKQHATKNPFFFQGNPPYPQSQVRCDFKSCLGCWRNFHGRNFQSVDAIIGSDHELHYLENWATKPIATEYVPIANADILRGIDPFKKRWSWMELDSSGTSETESEISSDEGLSLREELGMDEGLVDTTEADEID